MDLQSNHRPSVTAYVLDALVNNPGLTSAQLVASRRAYMTPSSVGSCLSTLYAKGKGCVERVASSDSTGQVMYAYWIREGAPWPSFDEKFRGKDRVHGVKRARPEILASTCGAGVPTLDERVETYTFRPPLIIDSYDDQGGVLIISTVEQAAPSLPAHLYHPAPMQQTHIGPRLTLVVNDVVHMFAFDDAREMHRQLDLVFGVPRS